MEDHDRDAQIRMYQAAGIDTSTSRSLATDRRQTNAEVAQNIANAKGQPYTVNKVTRNPQGDQATGDTTASNGDITAADLTKAIQGLKTESVDYEKIAELATKLAEQNIANAPRISKLAGRLALERAETFDEAMAARFFENIENILPDFRDVIVGTAREAVERVRGVAREFIGGEVPQDVQEQIQRTRAELGLEQGLFGPIAAGATARDIGLTSLDLVQKGAQLFVSGVSPLTESLLSITKALTPPVSDIPRLFAQQLGAITQTGVVSPTAMLQTAASVGEANANLAWDAQVKVLSAQMDLFKTSVQADLNRDMVKAQERSSWLEAGTTLAGAYLGSRDTTVETETEDFTSPEVESALAFEDISFFEEE